MPLWSRFTLAGTALGLAWWAHVSPQSQARLQLVILTIGVLIAGARHRGETIQIMDAHSGDDQSRAATQSPLRRTLNRLHWSRRHAAARPSECHAT
jgi:hypothetical protein